MTNNNEHWNTVDWSQIPEDVEAVVAYFPDDPTYYKMEDGELLCQCYRMNNYSQSSWSNFDELVVEFGNRFHLRPTPSIQLTPEPPESTQVESSPVEDTSVPEFDWSTVGDDVGAVIFEGGSPCQLLKQGKNVLLYKWVGSSQWNESNYYKNIKEREAKISEFDGHGSVVKLIMRPPATPPIDKVGVELVTDNCWISSDLLGTPFSELNDIPPYVDQNGTGTNTASEVSKVEKVGGEIQVEYVTLEKPSIQSILSDAQELINKHHNITGDVKFTIKCSYM